MTNQQQQKFNVWNFTYNKLCKGYLEKDKRKNSFEIEVKHWNDMNFQTKDNQTVNIEGSAKVLNFLKKKEVLEYERIQEEIFDETGKRKFIYKIKITKFNPKAKLVNKDGKEYSVFYKQLGLLAQ
jgi:hypothetical protein